MDADEIKNTQKNDRKEKEGSGKSTKIGDS
jgi:hypothetical protein